MHSVGPFLLGETIGRGSIGRVKLAVHKETGFKIAIKIVDKEKITEVNPHLLQKIEREIVLMKLLKHRNILKLYEVYETSKYLFLILEYAEGGELFEYLVTRGGLPIDQSLDYFYQLVTGLDYCHSHFVYHRDLKPENLLLSANHKVLKIADFGLAAFEPELSMCKTSCGSPHYASPEIIAGKKYDGSLSDVWSCGVILYSLVTGRLPFEDQNLPALLSKIKKGKYFPVPQYVPESVRDLIERCLVTDPAKRITLDEILVHPCLSYITKKYNGGITKPVGEDDSKSKKKDRKTKNKLLALAKSNSLDKIGKEDSEEDLPVKSEIVEQLQVLGWKESEIQKSLNSSKQSMIKTVYRLVYEHEAVPTEMIYNRAIEYKDEIELETSESMKRRSMSISSNPLKSRSLKNSAPARAVSTVSPPDPAGISSTIKSADSSNDASDLDIRKARRTLSDRRQVVRVRVRSGSIGSSNAQTPPPPNQPPATSFSSIREEFNDATLPALVNAV